MEPKLYAMEGGYPNLAIPRSGLAAGCPVDACGCCWRDESTRGITTRTGLRERASGERGAAVTAVKDCVAWRSNGVSVK